MSRILISDRDCREWIEWFENQKRHRATEFEKRRIDGLKGRDRFGDTDKNFVYEMLSKYPAGS